MNNTISLWSIDVLPKRVSINYCDEKGNYHKLEPLWQMEHIHRYSVEPVVGMNTLFPMTVMEFSL